MCVCVCVFVRELVSGQEFDVEGLKVGYSGDAKVSVNSIYPSIYLLSSISYQSMSNVKVIKLIRSH